MTGMCFSRPFHTSAQAIRGGLKLLQWRWLFSDISASSGFKNYFKLDRRVLPTGGNLNMTEDQSYKSFITESFCVQNETYLSLCYGPVEQC